ncbi:bifunctional ADP-dependent NAD(P)H-hydrate dehydratase/NAD(P)H-hydrate epimerase [Chryseobacterium taiwanense]|uniref:Bifunctional NAD(P)H-hydrate repair enzyme n=1 Tax=Chryseobacterium taiwanense TaxID=363331 RepID=A0A0B4EC09_9FLAO|nr:bifunctional ADP-dependent NAD(P)H-hydrate dehydratase/NAD(P)H-hydrate epimerase [Chryseobacterium taiwanense]KIC64158.1 sugar kinase [Chryseobacterium taiwanense]
MKIFNAEKIRECDAFTIVNEPVSSVQLMERAAQSCVNWLLEHCKIHENFAVFCGNGNNGGDGFAIARLLYLKGFNVDVFVRDLNGNFSPDATINYHKLKDFSGITVKEFKDFQKDKLSDKITCIDAIFGTGLSRKIEEVEKKIINELNSLNNIKISIDIPSGLYADKNIDEGETVLKADYTLSFQFWKKSFLYPETGKYTGTVVILDIGLHSQFINETETHYFTIDEGLIQNIFKPRNEYSHKGTFGKLAIVGGNYGKIGAAVLSVKAALKSGAGLVFALSPKCGYDILQTTSPEAMFIEGGENYIESIEVDQEVVLGIGPGLGTHDKTEESLINFLKNCSSPMILDADALNIISKDTFYIKLIPKNSIITPHPKEFERLFGTTKDAFERTDLAIQKAMEHTLYIVLKDHHTQIITPDGNVFFNITGNSGLAKGGSGDILTGILTSLLAQGYSSENTAILGVWLHGKSADFAAEKHSKESMQPTDVIKELETTFLYINKKVTKKL